MSYSNSSAPTLSGVSLQHYNSSFTGDSPAVDETQAPASFTPHGGPSFVQGDERDMGPGDSYVPPPSESHIRNNFGLSSATGDRMMLDQLSEAPGIDGVVRDNKTFTEFGDQSSETKPPGLSHVVHENQSNANSGEASGDSEAGKKYKEVNPTAYFVEEDDDDEDDD